MKLYGIILALALIIRISGLSLNPVGISHDEIHDLINAKSLIMLRENAPGTAAGIITQNPYCNGNCIFGELASYLLAPWMGIFPLGIAVSKIPFLLASLGIVYFGGKFFENLTGKKEIGYLTGLILAINPWAIHFGRSAFENLFSFCFFLAALYLFTKKKADKKHLVGATFLAFLGFLSYFGAKPLFVFIVTWGIFYYWKENKGKNLKLGWGLIMSAILISVGYILILMSSQSGKRFEEISAKGAVDVVSIVNEERKVSLAIPIIRDLVINKYTVTGKIMLDKFLGAFSPIYLFSRGEQGYDVFMISNHPYLYLIDGVMIILGLMSLGTLGSKGLWIVGLMGISTIPTIVSGSGITYALRSGLLFPLLGGVVAIGILSGENILKKKWKIFYWGGIAVVYLVSFLYFQIMYWYRLPFEKNTGWHFHERVLVRYLSMFRSESQEKIYLSIDNPVDVMYNYAFYTGKYNNKEFARNFNEAIRGGKYEIEGMVFQKECPKIIDKNAVYIWERDLGCTEEPNMLPRISETRDGGARFFIPTEKICRKMELTSYPFPRKIEDFSVEKMDKETFCKNWISEPKI